VFGAGVSNAIFKLKP